MGADIRWQPSRAWRRALAPLVAVAAAIPLMVLVARFFAEDLGANPIEEITHFTGGWTLRFLLLSLAVTPGRKLFRIPALAPLRRILGLAAFGYATLHLLTYVALDQGFAWEFLWEDVSDRRFITAGFAAFLCLLPLAFTSTRKVRELFVEERSSV